MRTLRRAAARFFVLGRKVWAKLMPAAPAPAGPLRRASEGASAGLKGRVVVITGSTRGIGKALATAFGRAGAKVVLNGRSQETLEACAREFAQKGIEAIAVRADVAQPQGAESLVEQAYARLGRVDVLINNAASMGPVDRPVWAIRPAEWDELWAANVRSAALCSAAAARRALSGGTPLRILNVSSGIVGHAAAKLAPYAVTKEALEGLTRGYAADDPNGLISVASIRPRSVRTGMTQAYYDAPMYALMDEPEAVSPMFLWAATANAEAVHGRSFIEPAFAADAGSAALHGPLAASGPIAIAPETFQPGNDAGQQPGAYMHLLENALGYYPSAAEALTRPDRSLYAYPDPAYRDLRAAIAEECGLSPEQIAVGAGSSELIDRMLRLFAAPGDSIVVTKPTWSFFHAFVQRWQLIPTEVKMTGTLKDGSLRHDLEGMLAAITPATRIVYLVNPCNPTGALIAPAQLQDFFARLPAHVVALLDEAYIQYVEPAQRPALDRLLASCKARLVVLRTFSKFFGLSGFRIGYACASEETVRLLARAEMPFCVGSPACHVAPAVLRDRAFRQRVYDTNATGRAQLSEGLRKLGLAYLPSQTNFILYECPTDPAKLRTEMRRRGLVLPNVDQFLHNYALLAVGRAEHNELVLETLSRY